MKKHKQNKNHFDMQVSLMDVKFQKTMVADIKSFLRKKLYDSIRGVVYSSKRETRKHLNEKT